MWEYIKVFGWVLLIIGVHLVFLVAIRLWFNRLDRKEGNVKS